MTWTLEDSKLIYYVNKNDFSYLDINAKGQLELVIDDKSIPFQDIAKIVHKKTKYKKTSFAIRVPLLITKQIQELIQSFDTAIIKNDYQGNYYPIYPIKVNSQKLFIESIIKSHPTYSFEAGTKSEFILLLHALETEKHRLIMCNGGKDPEYLRTINQAIEDGYNVCISIETILEMKDTLKIIKEENVQLALRIKPYVAMHGHWGESSGRHSKFGLSIAEMLEVVKILKQKKKLKLVTMLHAHPGSQVTSLPDFYPFAEFMANTFKKLLSLGLTSLNTINFGGGLPIDYDNSLDPHFMEKYAQILVEQLAKFLPDSQPNISTESGRAITATSTMIMVKVIEDYAIFPNKEPKRKFTDDFQQRFDRLSQVQSIEQIIENWFDWDRKSGKLIDPDELLAFEFLTYKLKRNLRKKFYDFPGYSNYLENETIRSLLMPEFTLQGNFSVFNSIADYVLVHQYFPVIPISDLHEQPETIARLFDITCDSDGKVATYHTIQTKKKLFTKDDFLLTYPEQKILDGFPISSLKSVVDGYLLIPLAGAYQDIIEFNHNLLGDLPDILVGFDDEEWHVELINGAQSISALLAEVGFITNITDDPYMDQDEVEVEKEMID